VNNSVHIAEKANRQCLLAFIISLQQHPFRDDADLSVIQSADINTDGKVAVKDKPFAVLFV